MNQWPTFRDAFVARLDQSGMTVAQIARRSGVSKGQLDKLRQGRTRATNVDDAIAIANCFGMTVNEFVERQREPVVARILELVSMLTDEEQEFFLRQLVGLSNSQTRKTTTALKKRSVSRSSID